MICITPTGAQHMLVNKANVIRYVRQSNALIDYYERRNNPSWVDAISAQ